MSLCGFTGLGTSYVRQGILFAMAMMLDVTHSFAFIGELEDELSEVMHWLNGVCVCVGVGVGVWYKCSNFVL